MLPFQFTKECFPLKLEHGRKWQKHIFLWRYVAENRDQILPSNYMDKGMHYMKGIVLKLALNPEKILTLGGLAISEVY
jgi:hypothetical protein